MKRMKTKASLATCLLMLYSLSALAADNDSQVLTFTGTVHGGKCDVAIPSSLDVGQVTPELISSSSAEPTHVQVFTIDLSNCLEGTSASISILGTADDNDTSVLKNDAASPAGNVGVAFWDIQKKLIKVNQDQIKTGEITDTKQVNLLSGIVKTSDSATVTPGDVSSSAQVKVDYL